MQGGGSAYACTSPIDGATACTPPAETDAVCQVTGGSNTWVCDLDRYGGTSDAEGVVVMDDAADWCSLDAYCAFGTTASGNGFCCEIGPVAVIYRIDLHGGAGEDVLAFQFDDGTDYHQLENSSTYTIAGWMYGEDNDDFLDGSPYWDSVTYRYDEALNGGAGTDVIRGWGGEDGLAGDAGDDQIYGGPDADYIGGGNGADTLVGGTGADTMYGEFLADQMNGGFGADTLYGGPDDDLMCGGDDSAGGIASTVAPTTTRCGVGGLATLSTETRQPR